MGTITFTVVGDVSVGTKTKSYAVSDADVNRFVNYCKQFSPLPSPTVAQALVAWADNEIASLKNGVISSETRTASAALIPVVAT